MSWYHGGPISGPFWVPDLTRDGLDLRRYPDPELAPDGIEGPRFHEATNDSRDVFHDDSVKDDPK